MPYAGGENPKVGDTVKHRSGEVGTVFELDLQADKTAKYDSLEDEKIKVKFDKRYFHHRTRQRIPSRKKGL